MAIEVMGAHQTLSSCHTQPVWFITAQINGELCHWVPFFPTIDEMVEQRTNNPFYHLEVGSPLELQQSGEHREGSVTLISENALSIQLAKAEVNSPFDQEQPVRLKYWDKQGIYYCQAEIGKVSGLLNQEIELAIVSRPVAMQRRGSFRLPHKIDVWLEVVDAIHGGLPPGKVFQSETRDISSTGLSFESDAPLKVMDELKASFHLLNNKKVDTSATVVTSEKVERKGKFVTLIGVEFHGLLPEAQNHLMEFLHELNPNKDEVEKK
jgi:hypothetical protein